MIKCISLILLLWATSSAAEEYQIFDGQTYNNLYYPRIDIIEWGEPLHLEFHVYQKDKPVNVSGVVLEKGGRKVFSFAYDLDYRGERRCRAVPAPPHWAPGTKLHFYSDKSDKDMDRIIVSAEKMKKSSYSAKDFNGCEEVAAFSARESKEKVAANSQSSEREPASKDDKKESDSKKGDKKKSDKSGEKYESDLPGDKDYFWF